MRLKSPSTRQLVYIHACANDKELINSFHDWLFAEEIYQCLVDSLHKRPGPRLNIKTVLSTYGDFHVKDKTAVRTSYL